MLKHGLHLLGLAQASSTPHTHTHTHTSTRRRTHAPCTRAHTALVPGNVGALAVRSEARGSPTQGQPSTRHPGRDTQDPSLGNAGGGQGRRHQPLSRRSRLSHLLPRGVRSALHARTLPGRSLDRASGGWTTALHSCRCVARPQVSLRIQRRVWRAARLCSPRHAS